MEAEQKPADISDENEKTAQVPNENKPQQPIKTEEPIIKAKKSADPKIEKPTKKEKRKISDQQPKDDGKDGGMK